MIAENISFMECDQYMVISANCDVPRNISYCCCTRCFGLYTSYETDTLQCPSSELKVVFNDTSEADWVEFYIENNNKQLFLENTSKFD